jgi:hypothetical protein
MYPGIPIAYPRLVFLEKILGSNLNPLVALGKAGKSVGFKGFYNKFNQDAELLDDLVGDDMSNLPAANLSFRTTTGPPSRTR